MTMAAMAPPERRVLLLTPPVEPLRSGFESADDGVIAAAVALVAGGNDDDGVADGLVTAGIVEGGTMLEDVREIVGSPTTGEA